MPPITVLIVDDSVAVRDGLQSILQGHADIAVVGVAGDGLQALELVEALQPAVVLMDAQMPRMDGASATRQIKSRWPGVRVIFLTVHESHLDEGVVAGADAAYLKDIPREALLRAIREAE